MAKQVPVPSLGRTAFFKRKGIVWVGVIVEVAPGTPSPFTATLLLFGHPSPVVGPGIDYGEDKEGCWWWPPRVDATMEVE
jgi:hypothetical protein